MAATAILKNQKVTYPRSGLSDFYKIWHSDAVLPSWPFRSLKFKILKIQYSGCRHREKSKIEISRQRFGRSPQNLAWWGNSTLMMRPTEICDFKNTTWRRPPFWKIEKSPYLGRSFSDFNEIWQGDAVQPSWPFCPLQIWNLKKSKMAEADVLKNYNISVAVWPIGIAFGKMTHIGPQNQTSSWNFELSKIPRWRTAAILKNRKM